MFMMTRSGLNTGSWASFCVMESEEGAAYEGTERCLPLAPAAAAAQAPAAPALAAPALPLASSNCSVFSDDDFLDS